LWAAIEKLSHSKAGTDCVPDNAALCETFDADKLTQLVGK